MQNMIEAHEVRTWSILAQLAWLAGFVIPFSGVIAVVLIYLQISPRDPRLRHDARAALNAALTSFALLVAILITSGLAAVAPSPILLVLISGVLGLANLVFGVYHLFAAVLNVMAINRGEPAHYSYAFVFVREEA